MIDPLTALAFSIYENKGVYCLLLGSGVSRPSEIPTGWEITLDLVRRIAALRGITDEPDWAAWYKTTFGSEPKYSELLDQLASTADERRSVLHSYIEPTPDDIAAGRKTPTRAHQAIARMVATGHVRVIITTNFDRLIENALRENGVEPTVITSDDALKGAVPLIHSRCYVVKIHGDYLDTRIRNTDSELAPTPRNWTPCLIGSSTSMVLLFAAGLGIGILRCAQRSRGLPTGATRCSGPRAASCPLWPIHWSSIVPAR